MNSSDLSMWIVVLAHALYPCRRSRRCPAGTERIKPEIAERNYDVDDQIRLMIAAGCLLGGIGIHFSGSVDFIIGVVIWLALAATIGYMIPYGWMVLVAPIPWLLGVGGGVLVGQHEELGQIWALPLALSTLAGVFGVIFGAAARRNQNQSNRQDRD